jgi:hypothetical protein
MIHASYETLYTHCARTVWDPRSTRITLYPVNSVHSSPLKVRGCPWQNYCRLVYKPYCQILWCWWRFCT